MEIDDLKYHMNLARREVRRVLGGRTAAATPTEFVDSNGQAFPIPRLGILRAVRDALVGHRPVVARGGAGSPLRRVRKKTPLPISEGDAASGGVVPGAGVGAIDLPADPPPLAPLETPPPGLVPGKAAAANAAADSEGAHRIVPLGFSPTLGKLLGAGENAEVADRAWMVTYPSPTRAAIGRTVTPGEGSFIGSSDT